MGNSPSIIVTGAGGFIGSRLVRYFSSKGWRVIAMARTEPVFQADKVEYVKYDLSEPLDGNVFAGVDYLVHCAYVPNDIETNIGGAKRLLTAARKNSLKMTLFLSSLSSRSDAISNYGKQKFAIELLFNTRNDCVVRAGVVLGDGGLFAQMSGHVRKGKRVPLIDGGDQPMQPIYIDDLMTIIDTILENHLHGNFIAADSVPVPYKLFFQTMCEVVGVKPKFVHVPSSVLNIFLSIAEALHVNLPITRENVLGLKNMIVEDSSNDLERLNIKLMPYRDAFEKLYPDSYDGSKV